MTEGVCLCVCALWDGHPPISFDIVGFLTERSVQVSLTGDVCNCLTISVSFIKMPVTGAMLRIYLYI